jgi:hypothetical protein
MSKVETLVGCACGNTIQEHEIISCDRCGDASCHECYTQCRDCLTVLCIHCTDSYDSCIICDVKMSRGTQSQTEDRCFIIIDGKSIPIKNPSVLISATDYRVCGNEKPENIIIKGLGEFKYSYRSIQRRVEKGKYVGDDYHLYLNR